MVKIVSIFGSIAIINGVFVTELGPSLRLVMDRRLMVILLALSVA